MGAIEMRLCRSFVIAMATLLGLDMLPAAAVQVGPMTLVPSPVRLVRGATCKTVNSCQEAVELWCGGYGRADGDSDGIPCENVCSSREEVQAIERQIGCSMR